MKRLFATLMLLGSLGFAGVALSEEPARRAGCPPSPRKRRPPRPLMQPQLPPMPRRPPLPKLRPPKPLRLRPPRPTRATPPGCMVATLLVIMMTIPGLALFYGGLVRSKNMLSVLMQVFAIFALITVLWAIYGYSLAFTQGNAFIGGFDRLFLKGIFDPVTGAVANAATFSKGVVIPEFAFVAFQATFAAITVALIVGAFAERMKFSAVLLFAALWFTFAYLPDGAHGLVLARPGCLHRCGCGCGGRGSLWLAVPEGRAGLRRWHRGAHQRRYRRSGRRLSWSASASVTARKPSRRTA